jgi:hypothetical protein
MKNRAFGTASIKKVNADALHQGVGVYSKNKASYRKSESRAACIMRRFALTRFFSIFIFLRIFKFNAAFPGVGDSMFAA